MRRLFGQGGRRWFGAAHARGTLAIALAIGLACPGASPAAEFLSTVEDAAILYDAPSSKSKRLFVLGRGYPLEVIVAVEGWTKVRDAAGTLGWVESRELGSKRMVVVKSSVREVRSAPDQGASIAFKVAPDVLLEWVETLPSGWTRVRHAEAGQGFIRTADIWGA